MIIVKQKYLVQKNEESRHIRIIKEENRIYEAIKNRLIRENEKLTYEVKQLKEIITVPRNHYKYLESFKDFDQLVKQKDQIMQDMEHGKGKTSTRTEHEK